MTRMDTVWTKIGSKKVIKAMKLKVVTKKKSDYVRFEPTFVFTTPWSIETTCY